MKQALIENTSIYVSRIAFGSSSLHHLFSTTQRQRLLSAAAKAGITHFDTSPYYGYGLAETDLGKFLRGHRTEFTVSTKVGLYPWGSASSQISSVWARKALGKVVSRISTPIINWQVDRARASLHESLGRLGTDYVDFLMLHEPDFALIEADEFLHWLESENACGTVRAWGVAGIADCVMPFVQAYHPLASVVQTQDSLDKRQADFLMNYSRTFQFTYGYLSSLHVRERLEAPEIAIEKALTRNSTGAILVSTCSPERITELAKVVA
jgi:aryl-alcohol dehydrogenase-like predicted oxidoreductase